MQTGICASRKGGWSGDALSNREGISSEHNQLQLAVLSIHTLFVSTETHRHWADMETPTLCKTEPHNAQTFSGEMSSSGLSSAAHPGQQWQCCLQGNLASAPCSREGSGSLELLKLSPKIPQVHGSFRQALTCTSYHTGAMGALEEECSCPLPSPNADPMEGFCWRTKAPVCDTKRIFFFFFGVSTF